jgi:hypothetical protein
VTVPGRYIVFLTYSCEASVSQSLEFFTSLFPTDMNSKGQKHESDRTRKR